MQRYCCEAIVKDPAQRQNVVLLIASALFIGWQHPYFLAVAVGTALFTFGWAQWMERSNKIGKLYTGGLLLLVISWLSFHYLPIEGLLFPLGMSFYTFQAIGYLTDVYWGDQRAERNAVNFLLYMLLFMKFLSGPIERGTDLLPQLSRKRQVNESEIVMGLRFVLLGLMKKLLIANHLSAHTAGVFGAVGEASGIQLWVACLIYPIELYADFSGYTDMAIGGARMVGIQLTPNFNRPFIATSTGDLWRRWHISLSSWVRDYVYVPLTAYTRDRGEWGVMFSLLVTFVALGLWHGMGASFAVYGLIQGLLIIGEMKIHLKTPRLLQQVRTYVFFALSLIFFRVSTVADGWYYITHLGLDVHHSLKEANIGMRDHSWIVVGSAFVLLMIYEHFNARRDLMRAWSNLPMAGRWMLYYLLSFLTFSLGQWGSQGFAYAQF